MRFVILSALLLACHRPVASGADAGADASAVSDSDAGLPPLDAPWLERIDLAKGAVAYVAPPLGSTEARPVIVAVHGAMDNPGAMCAAWRAIADGYAFVVCPSGLATGKDLYTWSSSEQISSAVDAALAAAHAKYGARMLEGPLVYAAFSQGANMAGAVLGALNHGRFARAQLTEGGYHAFEDPSAAAASVRAGAKRVLYTCAQSGCEGSYRGSTASLARAGALVQVKSTRPFGHSMTPQVRTSINAALPWLVEGLAGWDGYALAPKLSEH